MALGTSLVWVEPTQLVVNGLPFPQPIGVRLGSAKGGGRVG
jgi:hypothetical protein